MTVSSKENRAVKQWRQLSLSGHFRRKQGLFACEGLRLCEDAAVSGIAVQTVMFTAHAMETYGERLQRIITAAQNALEITDTLARFMADTTSPQGVFCICETPKNDLQYDRLRKNGRYLALEDVQDPANIGAVIRTAEALGIDGLLLSAGCCDIYNPKVLRGSMGGVFRLPMSIVADMTAAVTQLRDAGLRCLACVPDERAVSIRTAKLSDGCVCLIGNEGNGLKKDTIAACDMAVTIPMGGRAESLNAAMAAGIVLWEMSNTVEE